MAHFSEQQHPEYADKNRKWEYAWDHYTGEYADKGKISKYLNRKEQRESVKAHENRLRDTDPVLVFPTAVDGLNGILFGNSDKTEREWGAFGDPEEPDSIAYSLINNADGEGMNWDPLFKQVGIKETVLHKVWGLVEGVQRDDEGNALKDPHIKIIDPRSVVNWWPSTGDPQQVLVEEKRDDRTSIRDTESKEDQKTFILYELDGWTRFSVDSEGNEEIINSQSYAYYNDNDRSRRILPIFSCEIPMPRNVGYLLAQKQNHLFNKKSSRDWGVQVLSFAILNLVATQQQYESILHQLEKGANAIRQDPESSQSHSYLSPESGYLSTANDILEQDKKDFFESAFKQYGDAARQVTATEIRLESRSGIEAFLNLLVTSIDEFENNCFWRLEQVYFPDTPSNWGQARVKRSRDFQPEDISAKLESISSVVRNAAQAGAMSTRRMVELISKATGEAMTEEDIDEEVQRINEEAGAIMPEGMIGG